MDRMTVDNPRNNREALLNYAYAKDGRVYLSYADGEAGVDLCEYIAKNACCQEVDAAAVMDGACMECDCRTAILYTVAVQAAELRERLAAYEATGLAPEEVAGLCEMDKRSRMAKMLRWEEADAEGRLVILPCVRPFDNGEYGTAWEVLEWLEWEERSGFMTTSYKTQEEAEAAREAAEAALKGGEADA